MNHIMEDDTLTVAQLAISWPGALAVFTRHNIDYCCGGHRSLRDACVRAGLDPEKIQAEIEQTAATSNENFHPQNWSSSFLVDYIVENHHRFVRRAIPELEALLDRVCERHGSDTPQLLKIRDAFAALADDLTHHMHKEEMVLFPAIKEIEKLQRDSRRVPSDIDAPIQVMEHEHAVAGDLVKQIRTLSDNYSAPAHACTTFQVTFQKLREFDNDLMQHIHLENNLLFDRFKSH